MQKKLKVKLRQFRNYLLINRGLKSITIWGYSDCMKRVLTKLETVHPSHRTLRRYVTRMYKKEYSYSHIVNSCLAFERYMEFTHHKIQFGRPRKPKPIIKDTLTEAEVSLMLVFAKNVREKAILATLAYSGIRNKELCGLKVRDVDMANNFIRVFAGKGKKDRVVCIAPECSKLLICYLEQHKRKPEDWLFTTLRVGNKYHTGDLRKLCKVVVKRAGIEKRVYPHLLRHSLATNLLNRGANIFTVQHQLGHAFIDTTMVYLRSNINRIKSEYQYFTPAYA